MTKIQIRKVNGVSMARPVNPTRRLEINSHSVYSAEDILKNNDCYDAFEQSVTEHEAPGFEEGEAEGVLQWQHLRNPTIPTSKWQNCDEDDLDYFSEFGDSFQQIWIVHTPEKVEVKDKLQLYADISFVYTGSALHINNDEGLFIYLDKEEIIKVRDFLNGLVPSPPTH